MGARGTAGAARPEEPKLEARRAKAGVWFLWRGAVSFLPTS